MSMKQKKRIDQHIKNIPFVDLKAQYRSIKPEIDVAIQKILDSSAFIQGKAVTEFEEAFAHAHNVKHAIGCGSGTDALHLILWALNIGPGDEVIVPSHTFIATAEAVVLTGATPVFVDVNDESATITAENVADAITPRTKAIIPVHLYGQPCDLDPLVTLAQKHNLFLIEDACQAHLAEYKGKKVGGFGIAAAFSFYPGKNLGAYGEAGAVVTNDDELAKAMRQLLDHGQSQKYYHERSGHNYRMDGIQGAVLGVKMKYLERWTEQRRAVAGQYHSLLKSIPEIGVVSEKAYAKHVYHLYVIRTSRRNDLRVWLEKKGIATGIHYPIPLHMQLPFKNGNQNPLPITEKMTSEVLSLPMFPELSTAQINAVVASISDFFRQAI